MSNSPNPYQVPALVDPSEDDLPAGEAKLRDLRKRHRGRERSIRAIAIPYWVAGLICIVAGISLAVAHRVSFVSLIVLSLSLPLFAVGYGLRKLHPAAKIPVAIVSCVGLVMLIPLGTLINGYILFLIFSEKGKVVFSAAYREAIEATPDLDDRTSPWVWLAFLLLCTGGGVLLLFSFRI